MSDHGHPGSVLAALADERRLQVLAALVLGAEGVEGVAERTGIAGRDVGRAIERLKQAGLVADDLTVRVEAFGLAARDVGTMRPLITPEDRGASAEQAAVLRNYWDDGRITALPMNAQKRHVVLDYLAALFEPGSVYPEAQVNSMLSVFHPDVATMRRALVEEGFLERRDGFYWRTGGTFDVDAPVAAEAE